MASPTERRLAAIMFTDIVGYAALMARDEESGWSSCWPWGSGSNERPTKRPRFRPSYAFSPQWYALLPGRHTLGCSGLAPIEENER